MKLIRIILKTLKVLCISFAWFWLYLNLAGIYFLYFWNFAISSLTDWRYLAGEWQKGWVIDTAGEYIFFFSLLLFLPIFLLGWFLLLRINWKKLLGRPFAKIKEKAAIKRRLEMDSFPDTAVLAKELLAKAKEKAKVKVPPQGTKKKEEPVKHSEPEAKTEEKTPPKLKIAKEDFEKLSRTPETLPEPMTISRVEVRHSVLELAEKYGVRTIQDLKIGDNLIEIAFLAKGVMYLVNMEPAGNEWVADENGFEDEAPLWFSETKYEESPIYRLGKAKGLFSTVLDEIMQEQGLDSIELKKLLLVGAGNIINYKDMEEVWHNMEVETARLTTGLPEAIPLLDELLEKLASLGENDASVTELIYTALISVEP